MERKLRVIFATMMKPICINRPHSYTNVLHKYYLILPSVVRRSALTRVLTLRLTLEAFFLSHRLGVIA